jgi:GR25 family glycosyltransferase involved in LPS biosynthesis
VVTVDYAGKADSTLTAATTDHHPITPMSHPHLANNQTPRNTNDNKNKKNRTKKSVNIQSLFANKYDFFPKSSTTTSLSKHSPRTQVDWDSIDVPEPGYPKDTHFVDYSTSATENEIEKHDRLLVQGFHTMTTHFKSRHFLSRTSTSTSVHDSKTKSSSDSNSSNSSNPTVCLNLYLCNRRIPYINSLFMTMMSYSNDKSKQDFLNHAQVHLLNTEKRPNRMNFPYLTNYLSKLPFVHSVHNITYADEIYANITDRELDFRETFISDTISGLKICIHSGLPYCVMMEEDAVVPVDFMTLLMEQVIKPLERQGILNAKDGTSNETGSVSVLSLYSYYNLVFFGPHRLHYARYSKNKYQQDKAKINIERWSLGMPPYQAQYKVTEKDYKYGTVAMFYTRQSAIKLVEYLQGVGVNPIRNADEFINSNEYFPTTMGEKRKHVTPSLVNHIGYYSERMSHVKARGMFSQLNTDSRFMYDAGNM